MGTDNSPTYRAGMADGMRDNALQLSCPSQPPLGPTPPYPDYPAMYNQGYRRTHRPYVHRCTARCRGYNDRGTIRPPR